MEIKVKCEIDGDDYEHQEMTVTTADGKKKNVYVGPLCECPEDAIIGRDLIACTDIADFIEMGYNAAKNGEQLLIDIQEPEED